MVRPVAALIVVALFVTSPSYVQAQNDGRSAHHIFPQYAYGRLADGSFYQSTLFVMNANTATTTCQLIGAADLLPPSFTAGSYEWGLFPNDATRPFTSRSLSLSCNNPVVATVLYSYNSPNGITLAEATVFSAPIASALLVPVDQRNGKRLGLAIANDTDSFQDATIVVLDAAGTLQKTATRPLAPHSNVVGFVSELTGWNGEVVAQVGVRCTQGCAVIGLRYAGPVFTTIPAVVLTSTSSGQCAPGDPAFNRAQSQKLLGTWKFTYNGNLPITNSYTFTSLFENTACTGEFLVSGTDQFGGVTMGGYDPTRSQFWVGPTKTAPRFTFTFTSTSTVSGCYYGISGTCDPMAGIHQ